MNKNLLLKLWVFYLLAVSANINAQALFQDVSNSGLPAVARNYTVAGDYDKDGDMDLLIVSPTFAGIYKNNGSGVFEAGATLIANGLSNGSCAFGDYNNDGFLDALVSGDGGTGVGIVTKLFKNNGDGTFTEQSQIALPGIYYGTISFVDYNSDGFLDIHITGRNHATHGRSNTNRLFRNNRNGLFSEVGGTKITAGSNNSFQLGTDLFMYAGWNDASWGPHTGSDAFAAWGDINNDGHPDMLCAGYPDTKTPNYLSNGFGGFTPKTNNGLPALQSNSTVVFGDFDNDGDLDAIAGGSDKKLRYFKNSGAPNYAFTWSQDFATSGVALQLLTNSVAVADYDNDGDLDVAVEYQDGTNGNSKIYRNDGFSASPQFTALDATQFPITTGYKWGSNVWADFDNDGLLDLLVTGIEGTGTTGQMRLFKNTSGAAANIAPTAPATLSQQVGTSDVTLTWSNGNDPVQGSNLTYNLRVGTTSGGADIVNPSVNMDNKRQLAIPGRIKQAYISPSTPGTETNFKLKNLAPGTYYWSVQAVDNSFASSSWSTEQSFTITSEQAKNIIFSSIAPGTVTISWTKGSNGNSVVMIDTFNMYRAGYGATPPSDKKTDFPNLINDTTFNANAAFGSSTSKFRKTGWHCVYNGTGNSVTVTGISNQDMLRYSVVVIDYSGGTGSEKYNLNMSPGNPKVIPPTVNTKNITVSNVTMNELTLTWNNTYLNKTSNTNYNAAVQGFGRAVFMKEATLDQSLNIPVENEKIYNANSAFGAGDQLGNSGWYCIYNGYSTSATSSVTVTGLKTETPYTVKVVEYFNVPGPVVYNNQDTVSNPLEIKTANYPAPTVQASSIVILAASNSFDVSWTNGNGEKRVVFISKGNSGTPTVANDQVYTANSVFGQGTEAGTGWYCIYNGTGNSTSVTGLTINTEYIIAVYEYNELDSRERYLTDAATDNPFAKFTSNKLNQIITFDPLADKTTLDVPFTLTATGGESGNPVVYTSSNTSVATISGNTVTITGAGTTDITATQAGNTNYSDATPVTRTLTVNKAAQTIIFNVLSARKYLDPAFEISATPGASGNPVVFSSSNTAVATVSGTTVTIVGAGTAEIIASQAGNATYADAEVRQTLVVNKLPQLIGFDNPSTKTYLNAPFTLTATGGGSGNPVTFSAGSNIVSIDGNTVTILGAGTVTITASQAGNNNYEAAPSVPRTLTINKAAQVIAFDILPSKNANDGPFDLTAIASSGLPITYTSSDTMVASVKGTTVRIKKSGTINITAAQAGNTNFTAATSFVRALVINKISQTITFDALQNKLPGDADFLLGATVTSGRKITYTSSNPNVATIVGVNQDSVHIVGNGTTFITASQKGDSVYLAAVPVQRALIVGPTGISEISGTDVTIYPNPVTETLKVAFGKSMPETIIEIYSYTGQQVISVKAENLLNEIDMSNLAKGSYILKVVSPDGTLVKQIIKK